MEEDRPLSHLHERQALTKLDHSELEDKFIKLREQNIELKKYARNQEEKLKRMATKLLRLAADKKKAEGGNQNFKTEEKMAEMEEEMRALQKQNSQLKYKLTLAKQQSLGDHKQSSPYGHVKAKVNSGIHSRSKSSQQQRIKQNLRVQGDFTRSPRQIPSPILAQPRYGHSLLEEKRIEKEELEQVVHSLQDNIRMLEKERQELKDELRQKDVDHELVMTKIREQLSGAQRESIQENVDMIKLQREVKDKGSKLLSMETKFKNLSENLNKMKESHAKVLENMESMNEKLKEEQGKSLMYQNELKNHDVTSKTLVEQQQLIDDLNAEREILKQANENLMKSAFDSERERQHLALERQLKVEIATLEASVKSELEEKNDILDQLMKERDSKEDLHQEMRDIKVNYFSLKEKYEDVSEKLKFFTKESAVDVQELEEALTLIKRRKESGSQDLDFLEKVDNEVDKNAQKRIQELQVSHADTINELEKTRNMLVLQHKINKDYKTEVDKVTNKMVEDKKEYDQRLQEYAQLLDIRADRIKKLECQIRDIAYGTKQYNVVSTGEVPEFDNETNVENLERGENLFEIHIGKVCLSDEVSSLLEGLEPSCFITYEFFEHEIQATPVMKGKRMDFNFTSLYVVKVDDFFLHYLQKESTIVELHRAVGSSYETIAVCNLKLRELLERSHGRLHGTAKLLGTKSSNEGDECATMEYWVRLRVPMEQAIRLFKERSKALGYLNAQGYKALEKTGDELPSDINQLIVTINSCSNLKPRRDDVQPSPYVVYRLYDFADHDTAIISNSNSPQWNDRRTWPVPMTEDLHTYLTSQSLEVYVFDDVDPEATAYLGLAKIPLISLARDQAIKGSFDLVKENGEKNGIVDVSLEWRNTYLPASCKLRKNATNYVSNNDDEIESQGEVIDQTESQGEVIDQTKKKPVVPLVASTPKQSRENVVVKPPKARPRSEKKEQSTSKLAKSLNKDTTGESKLLDKKEIEIHKDMTVDELILASEGIHKLPIVDDVQEKEDLATTSAAVTEKPALSEDTNFDDESTDSEDAIEVVTRDFPEHLLSGSEDHTSDSDGLVMSSISARSGKIMQRPEQITIMVNSLTLYPDTSVINDASITQLFVAYKFLNYDLGELETPVSLPKPPPNQPIHYNFKKVFPVDRETNNEKRQLLIHTLSTENPEQGRLIFSVVSDPGFNDDGDCIDVAFAVVDLLKIFEDNADIIERNIELHSFADRADLVGCLTVTVEALEALKSLYDDVK